MPLEAYWINSYATNLLLMQGHFSAVIAVAEKEVESKEDGGPEGASLHEKKSQDKAQERRNTSIKIHWHIVWWCNEEWMVNENVCVLCIQKQ